MRSEGSESSGIALNDELLAKHFADKGNLAQDIFRNGLVRVSSVIPIQPLAGELPVHGVWR